MEVCLGSPSPSRLRPARRARHAAFPPSRAARRDLPFGDPVPGRPADLRALAAGFQEHGTQHERLGILDARATRTVRAGDVLIENRARPIEMAPFSRYSRYEHPPWAWARYTRWLWSRPLV